MPLDALQQRQYYDFSPTDNEVGLRKNDGFLELIVDDNCYRISRIANTFPISSSWSNIAFFDEEGKEIGMLKEPGRLDQDSLQILYEELEKSYFMPKIKEILFLEEFHNLEKWGVITNKGERTFEMRSPKQNLRRLGGGQILVKDVDGNRYEIPDWRKLSKASVALIRDHL